MLREGFRGMLIREMNHLDIGIVRDIAALTWKDTYSNFIPENIQDRVIKEAYSDETMGKRFRTSLNLIAENEGEITGYAFFSGDLSKKDVFLESLYIHPDHQRKGVGKKLLTGGLERFEYPETISLTVYKGNPNITFYERENFKVVKENKGDFFGHPVVFTVMKKFLKKEANKL